MAVRDSSMHVGVVPCMVGLVRASSLHVEIATRHDFDLGMTRAVAASAACSQMC